MYRILNLPGDLVPENREPLGSKKKLWFSHPTGQGARLLFKYNRPGTGEDWSEKIAAELAHLLGLPHAKAELATFENNPGVAVYDFTEPGKIALVHGNELLQLVDDKYPTQKRYRAAQHTVKAVYDLLANTDVATLVGLPVAPRQLPAEVTDAFSLFVGYLMLDAWIGNTDRHHENWGLLFSRRRVPIGFSLAPSFDHASSLGRELTDQKRSQLGNAAHGSPAERYARRAQSAFYPVVAADGSRALSCLDAVKAAAAYRPRARTAWVGRLSRISESTLREVVYQVPEGRMSETAKAFACAVLECNAKLLRAK